MAPEADGSFHVVENIGPHVCSFFMGGCPYGFGQADGAG